MPADFRPDPEVSPDFLLHALLLAHFNAQQSGLRRRGLPHLGSPKILFLLMRYPEDGSSAPSQKKLADLLRISPATVAASLKSLELCGYVTRHADEQDSRRNRISITAKGRQAMQTSGEVMRSVDEYMFHGFTPQEREQVMSFHKRMLNNLYQIGGDVDASCSPPPPRERMV